MTSQRLEARIKKLCEKALKAELSELESTLKELQAALHELDGLLRKLEAETLRNPQSKPDPSSQKPNGDGR